MSILGTAGLFIGAVVIAAVFILCALFVSMMMICLFRTIVGSGDEDDEEE